jgi:Domain of unknown function (DUF4156)
MRRIGAAMALAAGVAAAGCTWVKPTEGGAAVRVASESQVAGCEKLGRTTTQVLSKVLLFARSENKMTAELATLAQNEAARMGGNTVVPVSPIENGRQPFDIYRCKR